jgi:hypothetical protein
MKKKKEQYSKIRKMVDNAKKGDPIDVLSAASEESTDEQ